MKAILTAIVTFEFDFNGLEEFYGTVPEYSNNKAITKYIKAILQDTDIVLANDMIGELVDAHSMDIISKFFLDINLKEGTKEVGEIKLY